MKNNIKLRFAGIGIVLVTWAAGGAVIMLLWNALLPRIFGFPQLNYPEAMGIFALARILFGGFGLGGSRGIRERSGYLNRTNKIREKWMNMSDEERNEFIKNERSFAGFHRRHSGFPDFFNNEAGPEQHTEGGAKKDGRGE